MARFDVHAGPKGELMLDCQADILDHFETRFVVPLLPAQGTLQASRLQPVFSVEDRKVVMVTHLASAVSVKMLKRRVASLDGERTAILNALDMLIRGC